MKKIEATCTWGDGPDILININTDLDATNSMDLNLKEAKNFLGELSMAIMQVEELENVCKNHDENDKGKRE